MASKTRNPSNIDCPGKIFVGGLHKDTPTETFKKHFEEYGEIVDHVIMKDQYTQKPRGFGFVTYADPSVVDRVIQLTHVINGKQVEIKRTIPRGSAETKDFKTKKIFVGGVPTSVSEDEFMNFFAKYGKVVEHEIIRDHETNRSRGFGFVVFDSEQVVDDLLSKGNRIDFSGTLVEIKKAEPKKASNHPPAFSGVSRSRSFGDGFSGYDSSYAGYGASGFGSSSYRTFGGPGPSLGGYGGYGRGAGEMSSGYCSIGGGLGGYQGESSLGYSSRLGSYGGGLGGGYDSGLGGGLGGGYGREEGFGVYWRSSYGRGYDSDPGTSYGSGGLYGTRGGYSSGGGYNSGVGRYHPYGR